MLICALGFMLFACSKSSVVEVRDNTRDLTCSLKSGRVCRGYAV
jgi:hypothetical protein